MSNLYIDDKIYDVESLSDEAKAQVQSLQFVDAEILRLNATIAVCKTARNAYINALRPHLMAADFIAVKPQQH